MARTTHTRLLLVVVVLLVALGITSCGNGDASGATPAGAPETIIEIELGDMYVKPDTIEIEAGQNVKLHVKNVGAMVHDLKINGTSGTAELVTGQEETITVGGLTESVLAWCTLPGHRESGMEMKINVKGMATHSDYDTVKAPAPAADENAKIDAKAMPSAQWQGRDPVLPAKATGTVHEISINAVESEIEVAPGVTQMMWSFDGMVPGPVYHGNVGDTFRFTLTNKGKMGHSIDFHASKVAWNEKMKTINPGESLVYEFKAEYAGAYMYHCGTAPALHHIGNGMYGAIIIDPPNLAPVEQEFVMVQSELYLGPQGKEGSLTKMVNEQWDAVVFNGYYNQYKFAPIHVEANKRYRVWVVDDGPSENSAFHIVGTVFDTVFKEGTYVLQPDDRRGGSQVLDLQAAQGGFVEFSFAEDGLYPMVTHKFANVGKGALGFFAVGDVDTSALGGH
ncbi:MAG: hypothetical protein RL076_2419 [Chloroflexota bacterium]|jgi:nitrite reductase (NO-forming)